MSLATLGQSAAARPASRSVGAIILILGILDIGTYARVAKAGVISQNNRDYVLAARAMGADMAYLGTRFTASARKP